MDVAAFCRRGVLLFLVLLPLEGWIIGAAVQKPIMEYFICLKAEDARALNIPERTGPFATREEAERIRQKAIDELGSGDNFWTRAYIKEVFTGRYTAPEEGPSSPSSLRKGGSNTASVSPRKGESESGIRLKLKGLEAEGLKLKTLEQAEPTAPVVRPESKPLLLRPGTPVAPAKPLPLKSGTSPGPAPQSMDWPKQYAIWMDELDRVNSQIAATQNVLKRLNESILGDRRLFEEWEQEAQEGFERSVGMAADVAIDFSLGYLDTRYETILELAEKLPNKPADLIARYKHLVAIFKRLEQAKAANDLDGFAQREGKTDAEIFEMFRDGIAQIIGLVGLDKTFPVRVLKYGSMGWDMAYNLTELKNLWDNVKTLERTNVTYSAAVKRLGERMKDLQTRQAALIKEIEAGESGWKEKEAWTRQF